MHTLSDIGHANGASQGSLYKSLIGESLWHLAAVCHAAL